MRFLLMLMTAISFYTYGNKITAAVPHKATSISLLGKHVYWLASNGALLRAVITDMRGMLSKSEHDSNIKLEVRSSIDHLSSVLSHAPRFDNQDEHLPDRSSAPSVPSNDLDGGAWTRSGRQWDHNIRIGNGTFFSLQSGAGYTIDIDSVVVEGFMVGQQVHLKNKSELLGTVVGLFRREIDTRYLKGSLEAKEEAAKPRHYSWHLVIDKTNSGLDLDDFKLGDKRVEIVLANSVEIVKTSASDP